MTEATEMRHPPGDRSLRVVHVICTDAFAGVEQHVAHLAAAQRGRGHRVRVLGGDTARTADVLAGTGVPHAPAPTVTQAIRRLHHVVAGEGADIVHAHMTAAEAAAVAALLVRAAPPALVSTRHFAALRGSAPVVRRLATVGARRIDAQIAISRFVADHVEGHSTVVHPGVPCQPDATPGKRRRKVVLVVQRLEAEKRTDLALRAFARSEVASRGWVLEVAGDGSLRDELGALATSLRVADAVRFLGRRSDVASLMRSAGMLLAPCPVEGLGLAVLEAMAAGLPVVAAAAGGHLETAGAVGGEFLFPPSDIDRAAGIVADLAGDIPARDEYAEALQKVQRDAFTLPLQAESTDRVYRSVL